MQGQTPTKLTDALIRTLRGTCNVGCLWSVQRFAGRHFLQMITRQAVVATNRCRREGSKVQTSRFGTSMRKFTGCSR